MTMIALEEHFTTQEIMDVWRNGCCSWNWTGSVFHLVYMRPPWSLAEYGNMHCHIVMSPMSAAAPSKRMEP